jgi:tetratricopeptide (TPR) repeat protein
MAQKTNSFERFWKELKRRKTGKVIVAYAATAFILLQLADILTPALLLPAWTTRFITLLLIIGFPIAVIFSWVFDITPEGIKKTESIEESKDKETVRKPTKRRLMASNIIIAALIIVVGILAYPQIFKRNTLDKLRSSGEKISVAVMPFQNITNDTTRNSWQRWIQYNLINSLSNTEELNIRQTESVDYLIQNLNLNYASFTPALASSVSKKLDAEIFIYGSIGQMGPAIRIYVQLIDSKTEDVFKSFQIEGSATEKNIFEISDTLSTMVKDYLVLSEMKQKRIADPQLPLVSTSSPEAYRSFISGKNAFAKREYTIANEFFCQTLEIDSNFTFAAIMLTWSYLNQGQYEKAKKCHLRAYGKKDQLPMHIKIKLLDQFAYLFEGPAVRIKYLKQLPDYDDQDPHNYSDLGHVYNSIGQYDLAIPECKKALQIYKKWNSKPFWVVQYCDLGLAYNKTEQFNIEKKLYKKAEKDFPNNELLIYRQAILSLDCRKTKDAIKHIEKYKSIVKENSRSEADIITGLAEIYSSANILGKAEEYYRQALSLEPENPSRMNNLAYFQIDKDRNLDGGLDLVSKALELSPDDYNYLHTKGWGLYRQGKYQQALEILQKSWNIRREKAVYDHEAFLHLEAAKKFVVGMK